MLGIHIIHFWVRSLLPVSVPEGTGIPDLRDKLCYTGGTELVYAEAWVLLHRMNHGTVSAASAIPLRVSFRLLKSAYQIRGRGSVILYSNHSISVHRDTFEVVSTD